MVKYIKELKLILFFVLCFTKVFSQELVINGGFEAYNKCPDYFGNLDDVVGWTQLFESSDYFNACNLEDNYLSVPENKFGNQISKSGKGYAGLFLFLNKLNEENKPENRYSSKQTYYFREHLQTKLKSPLIKDKRYVVTTYISLAETSKFYTNKISFCFSKDKFLRYKIPYSLLTCKDVDNKVTYTNKDGFKDTNNWQKIELEYLAKGGEVYLTIALFKEDMSEKEFRRIQKTNLINPNGVFCYYYIDDVSVKAQ